MPGLAGCRAWHHLPLTRSGGGGVPPSCGTSQPLVVRLQGLGLHSPRPQFSLGQPGKREQTGAMEPSPRGCSLGAGLAHETPAAAGREAVPGHVDPCGVVTSGHPHSARVCGEQQEQE